MTSKYRFLSWWYNVQDNSDWYFNFMSKTWWMIPYDYRPGQLWYRFKCFVWHRYTTVKPRTLKSNTWCDRDRLLEHCMFEILVQFIENECGDDCLIDWEKSGHKVIPGVTADYKTCKDSPNAISVIDEMKDLYKWWTEEYKVDGFYDEWHKWSQKHSTHIDKPIGDDMYEWLTEWDSDNNQKIGDKLLKAGQGAENDMIKTTERNMIRLCIVHRFMWT